MKKILSFINKVMPKDKDDILPLFIIIVFVFFVAIRPMMALKYIMKSTVEESTIVMEGNFEFEYFRKYLTRTSPSTVFYHEGKRYIFSCLDKSENDLCLKTSSEKTFRDKNLKTKNSCLLYFSLMSTYKGSYFGFPIKLTCRDYTILGNKNPKKFFNGIIRMKFFRILVLFSFFTYCLLFVIFSIKRLKSEE